jgi:hypothetical protein
MNSEPDPLRDLLRATRPSGQDDADPEVQAARAASDAATQTALDAERAGDAEFARALRSVEPPAELEARLLTAMRAARAQVDPPPQLEAQVLAAVRTARTDELAPVARRQWFAWAAAAGVAAIAGGAVWWQRERRLPMARLTARLTAIVHGGVTLSLMSMDRTAVAAWLRDTGAPRSAQLPPALENLGRKGCHLYDIEGRPVSLECFVLPSMGVLHCFTTHTALLRDAPADGAAPTIVADAGLTVATWSRGGHTIVLASEEAPHIVRALLA